MPSMRMLNMRCTFKVCTMSLKWSILIMCLLFALANGNPQLCNRLISWANTRFYDEHVNEKTYDEMYVIAHGTESSKKCKYMGKYMQETGFGVVCAKMFINVCPLDLSDIPTMRGSLPSVRNHEQFVCPVKIPTCDPNSVYRTIDGSCNNLAHPHWGMAITAQRRHMANAYDDGYGSPRKKGCSGDLPNPRLVSNVMHASRHPTKMEPKLSYIFVQMGQFLSHDFVETKLFTRDDGSPLECCFQDRNNTHCNPIYTAAGGCMNFARSNSLIDCSLIRQPVNTQTSYLDLSMIYAPSEKEANTLRSFEEGKLRTVLNKLPVDFADRTCSLAVEIDPLTYYCPLSGDGRLNEQPGLSALHTLFVREHNRLAEGLSEVNPHWGDERLYEEARKINIGVWQHIVYSEYIPLILNTATMNKYGLHVTPRGYQDFYNPTTDPSVSNALAVAIFRFGHSLVQNVIGMVDKTGHQVLQPQPLEKHFFNPAWYHAFNHSGMDHVLRWSTSAKCPFRDRVIEDSVRTKLFQDIHLEASDLIAINIHRGRDHGTPGYTAFRRWCGLSNVVHFGTGPGGLVDHDLESAVLLKSTYSCPGDIDLFTGFISEKRSEGSILGPTGQCILAAEFQRLRDGDRFFYERRDAINPAIGFTAGQLNSIKQIKMSTLFCKNTATEKLQPHVFLLPNLWNMRWLSNVPIDCSGWRGVDFNLWKETPTPITG